MIPFKRILLLGDNSRAGNWGCQGTTASLKYLINQQFPEAEISSIFWLSYRSDTPEGGWPDSQPSNVPSFSMSSFLRKVAKRTGLYPIAWAIKHSIQPVPTKKKHEKDSVPRKAAEFDYAAKRMLDGEILPFESDLLKKCDAVVVNGEGSIYPGSGRFARYPLFLMYVIKRYLNKPCCMVNHTVEAENEDVEDMIRLVYPLLDYVAVREPCSARELERIGFQRKIAVVPDALFAFQPQDDWAPSSALQQEIDFEEPYICLGDSSGFFHVSWDISRVYRELIQQLQNICDQIVLIDGNGEYTVVFRDLTQQLGIGHVTVHNCSYANLYHVFAHSQLYISGRWHPSILCAMAGTPFILLGANSHKTQGFLELFDYPSIVFDLMRLPEQIEEVVIEVKRILSMQDILGEMLREKSDKFAKEAVQNVRLQHMT